MDGHIIDNEQGRTRPLEGQHRVHSRCVAFPHQNVDKAPLAREDRNRSTGASMRVRQLGKKYVAVMGDAHQKMNPRSFCPDAPFVNLS